MAWPDMKVIRFRSRTANVQKEPRIEGAQLFCPNVSDAERVVTGAAGVALAAYGLMKEKKSVPLVAAGAALVARATSGFCPVYAMLGVARDKNWPPSIVTETK